MKMVCSICPTEKSMREEKCELRSRNLKCYLFLWRREEIFQSLWPTCYERPHWLAVWLSEKWSWEKSEMWLRKIHTTVLYPQCPTVRKKWQKSSQRKKQREKLWPCSLCGSSVEEAVRKLWEIISERNEMKRREERNMKLSILKTCVSQRKYVNHRRENRRETLQAPGENCLPISTQLHLAAAKEKADTLALQLKMTCLKAQKKAVGEARKLAVFVRREEKLSMKQYLCFAFMPKK